MYPKPNKVSVHDITVVTLLGNNFIKIETAEPHAAASAIPSKALNLNYFQEFKIHFYDLITSKSKKDPKMVPKFPNKSGTQM